MLRENVERLKKEVPPGVMIVAAAKTRTASEVKEAFACGIRVFGENYVQEAERKITHVDKQASWHFIGHLQKNKVKKAVRLFDMIETVDSLELAALIDEESGKRGVVMPVLFEVNSAREPAKGGIDPGELEAVVRKSGEFRNLKSMGLMTMGPFTGSEETTRRFFRETKAIFEEIRGEYPHTQGWRYLSMGMSGSFRIAIEEGANIIRVGTVLFGPRNT